jgi:rRNA maturation endonuclease Nob1
VRSALAEIRCWLELAALFIALQVVAIVFVITATADWRCGTIVAAIALFLSARWLITDKLRRARRKRGHCVPCGYDLTGNESGACPECGEKVG